MTKEEIAKEYAIKYFPPKNNGEDPNAALRNMLEEIFLAGYNEALKWNDLESYNAKLPPEGKDVLIKKSPGNDGKYQYDVDKIFKYASGAYFFKKNRMDGVIAWRDI